MKTILGVLVGLTLVGATAFLPHRNADARPSDGQPSAVTTETKALFDAAQGSADGRALVEVEVYGQVGNEANAVVVARLGTVDATTGMAQAVRRVYPIGACPNPIQLTLMEGATIVAHAAVVVSGAPHAPSFSITVNSP